VSSSTAILVALALPLVGALGIALAARIGNNVRAGVTLLTAGALAWTVWGLLPELMAGGRPAARLAEVLPGIDIAFRV